jgi:hypothetical protein
MKRITLIITAFLIGTTSLLAQVAPDKYYIQFTDKDNSPYSISDPEEYLSQRAIDRREAFNIPVDMKDLPVNPQYIQGVIKAGAQILNPTKWLNGVTIQTDDTSVLIAIEALPYVENIVKSPVKPASINVEKNFFMNESYGTLPSVYVQQKSTSGYDYGPSYNQISLINGDKLHEMGYTGKGMIIAVLDAGYKGADTIPVFDSLWDNGQILGTKDFVTGADMTFNKHFHGTLVLSTMGGNYPGELVGTAPDADYFLLRTEDADSEYLIEEYNWITGAEYADSAGADILNTSLGYSLFWDPAMNHTYEDMDGNTTPITIGADIAASRGMVVVNSAGNEGGSSWFYITAPADGDSVFTVGAVNAQGVPASFSSHGPTSDERIKPNFSAQGEGTYCAYTDGNFGYGNGTSFSSPIMAGALACLWQSRPYMSNMELLEVIQLSGSSASEPNNTIGYGIPDVLEAHNIYSVNEQEGDKLLSELLVFPNPFNSYVELSFKSSLGTNTNIAIADMTGRLVFSDTYTLQQGVNTIRINTMDNMPSGIYFLRMEQGGSVLTSKLIKQ